MLFDQAAFDGRTVLVTGASSGIGRQAAIELSRCGARLIVVARNGSGLEDLRKDLPGGGYVAQAADLSDAEAASDTVEMVAREHGPLDGIFHSAGTSLVLPAKLTKNRHLDAVFGAGFRGAFGIARAAAKRATMVDGGSVVLMSSVSALRGRQGMAAYSAAKAAVDGMVRVLAVELSERRIRINSIVSGAVATEMHNKFVESMTPDIVSGYEGLHPLGFGRPEDIAFAALFLLSDASRWVTGTNLVVDGGYTAK
jgi:NAD(P)-dependent dehydrogenase (short-subunit alcohol dehydrogenase family)